MEENYGNFDFDRACLSLILKFMALCSFSCHGTRPFFRSDLAPDRGLPRFEMVDSQSSPSSI